MNDTISGSGSLSVSSIPYADAASSGTYTISLSGGLNNLLIPRTAFINSPLGQALLNTTNESVGWTTRNSVLENSWTTTSQNGAEWYGRVVGSSQYPASSVWHINVTSNSTSQSSSNPSLWGGTPADPSLEQGYESRAMEAFFTLNESTASDFQGLLGGLLLNRSGNFTGSLYSATAELPTLGLLPAVSIGLANSTIRNDGAYGSPTHSGSQHSPPGWWVFGGASWNVVSGIVTAVVIISMIWTTTIASMVYFGELAAEAALWGLHKLTQIPSTLRSAETVISSALRAFVGWVTTEATDLIAVALTPLRNANNQYYGRLQTDYQSAYQTVGSGHSVTQAQGNAFWQDAAGTDFGISVGLATAITVALGIISVLSLGAGFLIPLLIQLAISVGTSGAPSGFSDASLLGSTGLTAGYVLSLWSIVNATGATIGLSTQDWKTIGQIAGALLSIEAIAIIIASALVLKSVGVAGFASLILAVLSLFAYFYYTNNRTDKGILVYSLVLGSIAVLLGLADQVNNRVWFEKFVGQVGAGLGLAGVIIELVFE